MAHFVSLTRQGETPERVLVNMDLVKTASAQGTGARLYFESKEWIDVTETLSDVYMNVAR